MSLVDLQHINIRCADVDRTRDFYGILGLMPGFRPPFVSHGYWLYLGDNPVVHLVEEKDAQQARTTNASLGHVAFGGHDVQAMRTLLADMNITFREAVVPRDGTIQIFVSDPEGTPLELNFPPE